MRPDDAMALAIWRSLALTVLACAGLATARPCEAQTPRSLALIGGAKSEGPGAHDYPRGVVLLKTALESSPDLPRGVTVRAYPDGWPDDPAAFDGAATLVWYFDGDQRHPLRDPARRARFDALMRAGVGLVVLHQASTVPTADDLDLPRRLGAVRVGLYDRTTETTRIAPAAPQHPVSRGVDAFEYRDEFYPTFSTPAGPDRRTPILTATLHPQYRAGTQLVVDTPEPSALAWAYERAGGGRAFVYSGMHALTAFEQPMLRKALLNAIVWSAGLEVPEHGMRSELAADPARAAPRRLLPAYADAPTFHRDAQRSGWHARETALTPAAVAKPGFGLMWESPPLDAVDGVPARLYASPLYADRVTLSAGPSKGETFSIVFAASSNGYVYAINAARVGDVAAGRILWRTRLAEPCKLQPAPLDGVPTGVLSTPVIDIARARLYVTHCDPQQRWQAYALDITSGAVLPGWPVRLDEATFNARNRNAGPTPVAPTRRFDFRVQRGALNLSPDGSRLYITFGETETGWLVAVDTQQPRIASAFAAVAMPHRGSGGMWGAGGAAVDAAGGVFVATGTGFNGYVDQAHDWTQSVLGLSDDAEQGLTLQGTYTPFNHCQTAAMDIDLGSGGAMLLPDLDPASTSTPQLMALGGKQGNVYLLDRARLPGRVDRRPACSTDSAGDASLLPPQAQPQFAQRGPLNVFGPYSDKDAAMEQARGRSVPAYLRDARGGHHLFVTGNTRQADGSPVPIAPSLVRLGVVAQPGHAAYLRIEQTAPGIVFKNPGSPVVTSNGPDDAIVWVLDENAGRSALLAGADAPQPVLHAFDATTLAPLWHSAPGELHTSGKYNEPAFARGMVFVGTDRIQAFGLGAPAPRSTPRSGAAASAPDRAAATPAQRPAADAPDTRVDGAALYAARCAACHDHAEGSIPPRALIARRPRAAIVDALTSGAMRAQAQGLSAADIQAIARHLNP
jgi:mono/diheme cytochrome c family protein/type 1 glutamine amidotransferase